jgi:hypothetical protein
VGQVAVALTHQVQVHVLKGLVVVQELGQGKVVVVVVQELGQDKAVVLELLNPHLHMQLLCLVTLRVQLLVAQMHVLAKFSARAKTYMALLKLASPPHRIAS